MPSIRPYTPADLTRLREICVRTARAGQDATGLFSDDSLWSAVFLDPYLEFDPRLAFVVDEGGGAAGYIVATADTAAFVERYRAEWLPRLAERFEHVMPPVGLEQQIAHLGFTPERMLRADIAEHPAHLHIDLLPELQGRGLGRALIGTLLAELRSRGVAGVHLSLDPENIAALAFYERLGFTPLAGSTADDPTLGLPTG
ncbi:GNAT family N-acetyltransferase [Homoserinimonas aerilata]|nr:GNAT family N-acetyltransferase [Homoserinimonas aerilata]